MRLGVSIIKIILKIKIFLTISLITLCVAKPSFAEKISLDDLNDYINGLSTVKANFEQINSDGSIDTGVLYIRRPGKMRLEYAAPNNALVIAGAGSVAIFDDKTKNGPTLFPLKHTPLNLLLGKNVNLNNSYMISDHGINGENTFIIVQDAKRVARGKIKMVFSNNPIALISWTITDQSNRETKIKLSEFKEKIKIPLYLFSIIAENSKRN
ncbi:outer membrane lipoprotein carrier protein LolA [Amylibacter sp.]|nr:outer membrane lipoprotein carrier protein LolA [Amylibacter sp.]